MLQNPLPSRIGKAAAVAVLVSVSMQAQAFSWASVLAWLTTQQRELSALTIATKQSAVASNQIADAEMNSRKQLAVALGAVMTSDRVRDVVTNYDPNLGQPMLIKCDAQYDRQVQVEVFNQANKNTQSFMRSYATASTPSRAVSESLVLEQHRDLFCSVSEAKQGMCELKPNGMQAWDSNYSGPFGEQTMTPDVELAAFGYITNLVDTRAEKSIDCKSQACAAARLQNMETTAIGSMVAASLVGQVSMRRSTELE